MSGLQGLEEVMRLKRVHRRWVRLQSLYAILPVFAVVNRFRPMLTDGYGGDLLPTLLPDSVAAHYGLLLALLILPVAVSEILRRRFHARHKDDLAL